MRDSEYGFSTAEMLVAFDNLNRHTENFAQIHRQLKVDVDYAVKKWAEKILDTEAKDLAKNCHGAKWTYSEERLALYRQAVQEWDEGGREKVLRGTLWAYKSIAKY